jgi:hypothetical protein
MLCAAIGEALEHCVVMACRIWPTTPRHGQFETKSVTFMIATESHGAALVTWNLNPRTTST